MPKRKRAGVVSGKIVKKQPSTPVKPRIAPALKSLAVDIDSLVPDPQNPRLHNDRNLEAIKASLEQYGQCKPIVVRREGRVIIAGNGTWEAARALGWDKIAASFVDMSEVEAAGYGLADNRTGELAQWDFDVVARLDRLIQEHGGPDIVGWSDDELLALRRGMEESESTTSATVDRVHRKGVSFLPSQFEAIIEAVDYLRARNDDASLPTDESIEVICREWLERERGE